MKNAFLALLAILFIPDISLASHEPKDFPKPEFYRELTRKIRPKGQFRIYMPNGQHQNIDYSFEWGELAYLEPKVHDSHLEFPGKKITRFFWDRIFFKDGSYLNVGGEKVPLTCVFVEGQDNRFSGTDSPLFPEIIMRVYLVANDFACQGPIRPGWPRTGGKKENWDTLLKFEVRDPTIMLPQDAMLRFHWNEASAVLIDKGE